MDKKLKKKINIELKHNRLWRVKELYSSAIKYHEYDQELYFEYAKILFEFGDYMESGKYFLLTDTNEEKYIKTIKLFTRRHQHDFFYHLPRKFRKIDPKNYPANLKNLLDGEKALKKYFFNAQKDEIKREGYSYQTTRKENFIISIFLVTIVTIFLIGLFTVGRFLWSLL